MEYLEFILYGFIQGLTEFITVSSTDHLKIIYKSLIVKNLIRSCKVISVDPAFEVASKYVKKIDEEFLFFPISLSGGDNSLSIIPLYLSNNSLSSSVFEDQDKFSKHSYCLNLSPSEFFQSLLNLNIISNENEKVALSIRELDGNPFDELNDKKKGDIVTCTVTDIDAYGVKVAIGENGPKVVIKKNDLAIQKGDARPERWAKNDKLDAMITQIDASSLKIALSIRALEEQNEAEAMEKYGSKDSGASLGDILGKAISDKKSEE